MSTETKDKQKTADRRDDSVEAELDEALEDTFPASDPVALTSPTKAGRRKPDPAPTEDGGNPQPS